jgi:transposase-like protein
MYASTSSIRERRIFRRLEERLKMKLTLEPGASVVSVALANGVNANQVFRWKGQYERGELQPRRSKVATSLVPLTIAAGPEAPEGAAASKSAPDQPCAGMITIEFPGRALLSIEGRSHVRSLGLMANKQIRSVFSLRFLHAPGAVRARHVAATHCDFKSMDLLANTIRATEKSDAVEIRGKKQRGKDAGTLWSGADQIRANCLPASSVFADILLYYRHGKEVYFSRHYRLGR